MDSGSDWDSLSGDGPSSLNTKSAIKPTRQKLKVSGSKSLKKLPKEATHELTDDNENTFKTVEFEDKSYLERWSLSKNTKQKGKKPWTNDDENLPYLNFKAREMEHIAHDSRKQISTKHQYEIEKEPNSDLESQTDDDVPDRILENNNVDLCGSSLDRFEKNDKHEDCERMAIENRYVPSSVCDNGKEEKVFSSHFEDKVYVGRPETFVDGIISEKRYSYERPSYDFYAVTLEDDAVIPKYADKMERHIHRAMKEFFGLLQIILNVIVIFLLEFFKFIFKLLIEKLAVGLLKVTGDFFIKPFVSTLFNSVIQPLFILQWNVLIGLKQMLQPIVVLVGDVMLPFATLLQSFRLFEYKCVTSSTLKEI